MKGTAVIAWVIAGLLLSVQAGFGQHEQMPALDASHMAEDAKPVTSVEEMAEFSRRKFAFSNLIHYHDWRPLLKKKAEIKMFFESATGLEGYLPMMFLIASGEKIDPKTEARFLCLYLDECELYDEWGFYDESESAWTDWYLAKRLVACGKGALPWLEPLLKKKEMISYGLGMGSEMQTMTHRLWMRKCDVASHYAAQILGLEWALDAELSQRDARIGRILQVMEAQTR